MDDLKPCPFCGGEAETDHMQSYRAISDGRLGTAAAVYCLECSASMTCCYADMPGVPHEDVMAQLVDAWNTRQPDAIEALQEKVTRLQKLDVEYGRVETAIIMADPHFDGDSDHANCADRLIASVQRMKAQLAEARDKALEDAARMVDCACECREAVLTANTRVERWTACGRDPCGALDAAAIRAMKGERG